MKTGFARTAGRLSEWFTRFGHEVEVLTEGKGCYRIGKVAFLDKTGKAKFKEEPDVVQIVGPTPFFSEQCVKVAKKHDLPVVYHVSAFPGLSSYYHYPGGGIVDSLYKKLNLHRKIRNVDLVVSNTDDFVESCLSFYDGAVEVIPDGVDSDGFNGYPDINNGKDNRILFVGQLRRYKGLPYLIEAVKILLESNRNVVLEIVGGGPDRERLLSLVAKLKLQEVVRLHGELTDKELELMYARSSVFVLPSIQSESFGIVLLEAAAHGVPVVASDLPGVRELVRFLGGTLVPPQDSEALAKTLQRLLDNPTMLQPPRFSIERFLWKNVAKRYLKSYEKITGLRFDSEIPTVERLDEQVPLEMVQ